MHNSSSTRRVFIARAMAGGTAIAALGASAQSPRLDEKDAAAVSLGYVADTAKADEKKYAKHTKDQKCGTCQLFQGKPTDAAGGCPLFTGKQVATGGWCSAWVKKAG